jgi:hypothetical protein
MKRYAAAALALTLTACAGPAKRPLAPQVYVVQNGLGSGEIKMGLAKDGCGLDCPELLGRGAAVRILAKPAPGSLFDGFSGPCTGRMPCVVPLDNSYWVAASFSDAAVRFLLHVGEGWGYTTYRSVALDAGGGIAVAGAGDAWLQRYDRDGKKSWEMRDSGESRTKAAAVAFDAAGDIIVVGKNEEGALVEKRGAAGGPAWRSVFQGAARATGVAIDGNGDVLVCGTFSGVLRLGKARLESAGGLDVFVARVSSEGKLLGAGRLGGKEDDRIPHVVTNGMTGVLVAYTTAAESDTGMVANGRAHLVRLEALERVEWDKEIGGRARIDSIAPGKHGEVVIGGRFEGAADVFGRRLQSNGAVDALVAAIDGSGAASWARSFGGKDKDEAASVAVAEDGRVAWLGTFQQEMLVGETKLVCKQYPHVWYGGEAITWKGIDIVLGVLSPDGEPLSARAFGGSGTDFADAIAWAPGGDVVMLVDQEVLITSPEGGIASRRERLLLRRPPAP